MFRHSLVKGLEPHVHFEQRRRLGQLLRVARRQLLDPKLARMPLMALDERLGLHLQQS